MTNSLKIVRLVEWLEKYRVLRLLLFLLIPCAYYLDVVIYPEYPLMFTFIISSMCIGGAIHNNFMHLVLSGLIVLFRNLLSQQGIFMIPVY
jgi:hypothetical protein